MDRPDLIAQGRHSFERRAWSDAREVLARADREAPLDPEDLGRLATAAYLVGRDAESTDTWARAHQAYLGRGEVERAVRCAFWLAFGLLQRGERARGGGWIARAERLLADCGPDCAERGYLLLPAGLRAIAEGDVAGGYEAFSQAAERGEQHGDPDLIALALHSRGRALMRMGERDRGVTLLDEAMAAVEAGGLAPIVAGTVYCSVIEGCLEIFDLRRAQEWTAALSHWCEAQPDLVPYRGQCLVRRAELMRLQGAWSDALDEAQRACEWLTRPPGEPAAGEAFYQRAELHRLRGELGEADEGYRLASRWGKNPQPGLAELRLAQGRLGEAEAAIRGALDGARDRHVRSRLLPAFVEIVLSAGDVSAAREAAEELVGIAEHLEAPLLGAVASRATGAVLLAEGDARAALAALRRAWTAWQELDAPYEGARVRVLIGLACRELEDPGTADLELDAARRVFEKLGAARDLAAVQRLTRSGPARAAGGLTRRQVEVLRLVATGKTNRAIAGELHISEKTVARHLSNIFLKLKISSRAAATAYAYEHGIIGAPNGDDRNVGPPRPGRP